MKAQLNIAVDSKNGIPFLKHAFFTTPFKIMNITEDKKGKELQLMLMSSSPGMLDGDEYELNIAIAKNCCMRLHTQAYQRIFNMKMGATQQMDVHVADNASFCYLPHPSVPHEQSVFTGRNNFYLGNNSRLIFGEILTCGRKLNGEIFRFSKYHSINNIYVNDQLVIRENLLMQPSFINVNSIGQLEGYTHQASVLYLCGNAALVDKQQLLIEFLSEEKNIESGITAAPVNGLIIRLLGNGAEQLFDCVQRISQVLQTNSTAQHVS